ncbi:MAG: ATP-binding protein [Bacteroidaceae bacterium]|nr:ATP-binding protein [Bacteroidaceae bacterium]
MKLTEEIKHRISSAIESDRLNYPSDAKHAVSLGISASVYNSVKKGQWDRQVSDASWLSMARRLGVVLVSEHSWQSAETPTYVFVSEQLRMCQEGGLSAILCDMPNIGKTFTARVYVRSHRNAVYVDCSQVKSKQRLIRYIAKEFGVSSLGRYADVYEDLVYYLRSIDHPLVVLDEAGDLQGDAFLELKALWNATERSCGWYMMGADGLKEKIRRSIECKKVGYAELFSRYGHRYSKVTPDDEKERQLFLKSQAAIVAKVNAPAGADIGQIVRVSGGGLRRVYTEIEKLRTHNQVIR